jgi:cephalosporin hydroxylase
MFDKFYDVSARRPSNVGYMDGVGEIFPWYRDVACPVELVLQGHWEFPALLSIYKDLAPLRTVEIGSFMGGTLWSWIQNSQPGVSFTSVDMLVNDERRGEQEYAHNHVWKQWANEKSVNLRVITGDSHNPEIIKQVSDSGPIDFLFIDGDHSYDGVKRDFCDYGPLVRDGGIIVLHDILFSCWWGGIEVYRFWDEIKKAGYITQELYVSHQQLYPLVGACGIGVVYVKDFKPIHI